MQISNVVTRLISTLPEFTDYFTDNLQVSSVSVDSGVLTVTTTTPHFLEPNNIVYLKGFGSVLNTSMNAEQDGNLLLNFTTPHDVTFEPDFNKFINIFVDVDNQNTVKVLAVPNDLQILVEFPPGGLIPDFKVTGASNVFQQVKGVQQVQSVPTPNSFTITVSATTIPNVVSVPGGWEVRANPRISMGIDPVRIQDIYVENKETNNWLFVVGGDRTASSSNITSTDATTALSTQDNFRQQIIYPISLLVFTPVGQSDLAAAVKRDEVTRLFPALNKSVLGFPFPVDTAIFTQGILTFDSDIVLSYDTSLLVYAFNYELTADLICDDLTDRVEPTVALRKIIMSQIPTLQKKAEGYPRDKTIYTRKK